MAGCGVKNTFWFMTCNKTYKTKGSDNQESGFYLYEMLTTKNADGSGLRSSNMFLVSVKFFFFGYFSHLDHIGALPYFTEVCGYRGPIYMTVSLPYLSSIYY